MSNHPTPDDLEKYSLKMLTEDEVAQIEEHLLWCEECCRALVETDEYILAMRQALKESRPRADRLQMLRADVRRVQKLGRHNPTRGRQPGGDC